MSFGRRESVPTQTASAVSRWGSPGWWVGFGGIAIAAVTAAVFWPMSQTSGGDVQAATAAVSRAPVAPQAVDPVPAPIVVEAPVVPMEVVARPPAAEIQGLRFTSTFAEVEAWAAERGGALVCPLRGDRRADCVIRDVRGLPGDPRYIQLMFQPGTADGVLQVMWFDVRQSAYQGLLAAARQKYGPEAWFGPDQLINRQGHQIQTEVARWDADQGSIFVERDVRDPLLSRFSYERKAATPIASF